MTFAQPLPWWALVLALAGGAWLAWYAGWRASPVVSLGYAPSALRLRRTTLVALRAVTVLALLVVVMRPIRLAPDPSARGVFTVLVDASRSMGLVDVLGRSRIEAAEAFVRETLVPALPPDMSYEVLAFGEDVDDVSARPAAPLAASSPTTDVGRAIDILRRRASVRPITGVLVISDGGFATPDESVMTAYGHLAPVYTLGVGSAVVSHDREVRQVTAGEAAMAGTAIDLTATVVSTGEGSAPLEVRLAGNGRPLEVRRVTPAGEGVPTEVVFRVAPETGVATLYTVEVDTRDGELTIENNRRAVLVSPAGRARRVLLLEGAPGYEHSFLKRALEQDAGLEVDAVVRKGANDAGRETFYVQARDERGQLLLGGFPPSRQALFAYDAVILANIEADALTAEHLDQLSGYVGDRGGGLLVLGARTFDAAAIGGTPLEELLPLEVSDRRAESVLRADLGEGRSDAVTLTPDGERHPVMRLGATTAETRSRWAALPALPWVASVGSARAGASVLATTSGPGGVSRPLVAVQRFGRGRVIAFSGEATWRWRMMLPSSDLTYATFWRQATRWLAAGSPERVSVRSDPAGVGALALVVDVRDDEFRAVRDRAVTVRVKGADGATQALTAVPVADAAGTYRTDVRVPAGVAHIEVEATAPDGPVVRTSAWALVGADDAEFVEPHRHDGQLARLAERLGGRLIRADEIDAVIGDVTTTRARSTPLVEQDLWHSPWVLGALLALLLTEWALRRRWGWR